MVGRPTDRLEQQVARVVAGVVRGTGDGDGYRQDMGVRGDSQDIVLAVVGDHQRRHRGAVAEIVRVTVGLTISAETAEIRTGQNIRRQFGEAGVDTGVDLADDDSLATRAIRPQAGHVPRVEPPFRMVRRARRGHGRNCRHARQQHSRGGNPENPLHGPSSQMIVPGMVAKQCACTSTSSTVATEARLFLSNCWYVAFTVASSSIAILPVAESTVSRIGPDVLPDALPRSEPGTAWPGSGSGHS